MFCVEVALPMQSYIFQSFVIKQGTLISQVYFPLLRALHHNRLCWAKVNISLYLTQLWLK